MDLITLDRALLQLPNAPDSDYPIIAAGISAASSVIETYCNRVFAQATYDELHTVVGPTCSLWVNNPPILDVVAVRNSELPAIYIQCNDPSNIVQLATVDVTSSAVVLKKIQNNVVVTNATFSFVSYPTFTDLHTAVNALGNGWVSTLPQQFSQWQTADLTTNQTGRSARNISCPLTVYWYYLYGYKVNKPLGEIYIPGGPYFGHQVYRITYSGGYVEIPEEIQQATAELVQLIYFQRNINPMMMSETLDKYSYTRMLPVKWFDQLSVTSQLALQQNKVHRYTVEGTPAKE